MKTKTLTLILALSLTLSACTACGGSSERALTNELSDLLQQFYTASVKGDTETMNKLLADDFAFSPASGTRITKEQVLAYNPREGLTFAVSEASLASSSADEAVLNYTENTLKSDTISNSKKQSAVFKKKDGRWQISTLRTAS